MRKIVLFLILFIPLNIAYAKLHITYMQTDVKIIKILDNNTLLCESGTIFKQGNDQIKNLELYVGKNVYVKYFNLLKEDFYVDIKYKIDGEFDLSPEKDTRLSPTAK